MTIDLRSMTVAELQAIIDDAKANMMLEGREEKERLERVYAPLAGTPISLAEATRIYGVPSIWLHKQMQAGRLTGRRLGESSGRGNSNMLDACEVAVIVGIRQFAEGKGLLKPGSHFIEQVYK